MWSKFVMVKSHLSNRKQYIGYKDDFSEQKSMGLLQLKCGVTQDSIIGALFFINKQMIFPLFRNTYH